MNQQITSKIISKLRGYETKFGHARNRPVFLFLCGGDYNNPEYKSRKWVEEYLGKTGLKKPVVCVTPEVLLREHQELFANLDMLKLESFFADLSDVILLFDESWGSVCELGAFAGSDSIRPMLTAVIPKKYKSTESFIIAGPVRRIESQASDISRVIYADLSCLSLCVELTEYLNRIYSIANKTSTKKVNRLQSQVEIGSLCLELLDLISVFSPLTLPELIQIYRKYKGFGESVKLCSNKVGIDTDQVINFKMIVAFLDATELIDFKDEQISIKNEAPGFFMFNQSYRREIMKLRAQLLSRKRKRKERCEDVNLTRNFI